MCVVFAPLMIPLAYKYWLFLASGMRYSVCLGQNCYKNQTAHIRNIAEWKTKFPVHPKFLARPKSMAICNAKCITRISSQTHMSIKGKNEL